MITAQGVCEVKTATISNGSSLSDEISINGCKHIGIQMPAAWTAAVITFAASDVSGGTFNPLCAQDGSEITVQAAASKFIAIDIDALSLAACPFFKIRSGTSSAAVNQLGDRTLKVVVKN